MRRTGVKASSIDYIYVCGLRTLVKRGIKGVVTAAGQQADGPVVVGKFKVPRKLRIDVRYDSKSKYPWFNWFEDHRF